MASPKPHPDPPAAFNTIDLPIVRRFRQWFRVHGCHLDPLFFGMTRDWRYDDPEGEFGVLYVASDFEGAFVEGCVHDDGLERLPRCVVCGWDGQLGHNDLALEAAHI